MNPSLPELLTGALVALSDIPPPEAMGDFMGGKIGVIGLISFLCAQEAERGVAVRVAENRSIRALFDEAADAGWAPEQSADLRVLAATADDDLTLSALDRANAALRTALIALQAAVEADPAPQARDRERKLMALLLDHARARRLVLPGEPV